MKRFFLLSVFAGALLVMSPVHAAASSCLSFTDPANDVVVTPATSTDALPADSDFLSANLQPMGDHWQAEVTTAQPLPHDPNVHGNVVLLFDADGLLANDDDHPHDARAGSDAYWSIRLGSSTSTVFLLLRELYQPASGSWHRTVTAATFSQSSSTLRLEIPFSELPKSIKRWRVFAGILGTGWTATDSAPTYSSNQGDCGYLPMVTTASSTTSTQATKPASLPTTAVDDSWLGMLAVALIGLIFVKAFVPKAYGK